MFGRILGKSVDEVAKDEYRRCCYVLAHLASLDPLRFGSEYFQDTHFLCVDAKGNARDISGRALDQLTKEDVLTMSARQSLEAAMDVKGWSSPREAAGTSFLKVIAAGGSHLNPPAPLPDEASACQAPPYHDSSQPHAVASRLPRA